VWLTLESYQRKHVSTGVSIFKIAISYISNSSISRRVQFSDSTHHCCSSEPEEQRQS